MNPDQEEIDFMIAVVGTLTGRFAATTVYDRPVVLVTGRWKSERSR
jgi:hypothetical protein